MNPAREKDVATIINNLNLNKSTGPYREPMTILKNHIHVLKQAPNSKLSFQEALFPEYLKTASAAPVYKKDDLLIPPNYCHISVLSVFQ